MVLFGSGIKFIIVKKSLPILVNLKEFSYKMAFYKSWGVCDPGGHRRLQPCMAVFV